MTEDRSDILATPDGYIVASSENRMELQAARDHAAELVARFRKGKAYLESEPDFGQSFPSGKACGDDG